MKRNEVEKITGLRRKAILYYEEKKLISPAIEENNYRDYSEEDLNRLIKISLYRRLGLNVSEIKNILDTNKNETGKILRDRDYKVELEKVKKDLLERIIMGDDLKEITDELNSLEKEESIYEKLTRIFPGYFGQAFFMAYKPFLKEKLKEDEEKAFNDYINFLDHLPEIDFTEEEKNYIENLTRDFNNEDLEKINSEKIKAAYNIEDWLRENKDNVKAYEEFLESEAYENSILKKVRDKIRKYMIENNYYEEGIPLIRKISPSYNSYYKNLLNSNKIFLENKSDIK
ncbi:MerR family transcriptional regulator [Peptoniphilus gorbachii]|uniref:DNA-binding transcriptional MerR regulator n=1 Tax=Peptoniphilus gorbachii TaxID=411567 RepID=A0ABS2MJ53_9FIRM|nr:MerR family transcriptional regulator [Peptoniphilus gorbachii]MBM7550053.1 DNA-binding transcriptional MerR regulator [Peptoniphilus gorbachii]